MINAGTSAPFPALLTKDREASEVPYGETVARFAALRPRHVRYRTGDDRDHVLCDRFADKFQPNDAFSTETTYLERAVGIAYMPKSDG